MAKSVNSRNTKTEILSAYKEAVQESKTFEAKVKALEKQLATARKAAASKSPTSSPPKSTPPVVSRTSTQQIDTLTNVIASLNNIQTAIGNAIGTNSAQQLVEAESLALLQEQFTSQSQQLKELFDLDIETGILDKLVAEYEESKAQFNEKITTLREAHETEMKQKAMDWEKEQEAATLKMKEQKDAADKNRKREMQEHNYNLKQERAKEDDTYALKKKALQQELDEQVEAQELTWAAKEKVIAEQEATFLDYKTKFEALPEKLEKGIKKAEAEGANIIKRQAKIKAELLAKEVNANKKATELKITSLKTIIEKQEKQVQKLTQQLESALEQAQNLAVKAIEGSSNSTSFEAIRQIALEQAKHSNGKK